MSGGIMVCGTASDVGKSHVVTGLCRLLARNGVRVAPFKAQNMALNSFVTPSGHEIGRAQGIQALAAGTEPDATMNPILLKPTSDRTSQVVVLGRPTEHLDALAYHARKPALFEMVLDALADLRRRYDVVVCEGAGSPAEINLADDDIVNLRVAAAAALPAIIVGDIDRGGVFGALYGTVSLLPEAHRRLVRGFVINKFRGDPALLGDGLADLERRCGIPTLGVLPWLPDVALDAEDSLALPDRERIAGLAASSGRTGANPASADSASADSASADRASADRASGDPGCDPLEVVALAFPRISNFTDLDALIIEPAVTVRMADHPSGLGDPDLIIMPGTKATVADLVWMRERGLDRAIARALERGVTVLGICGGYQMLGATITDRVESASGTVAGLGWLDVTTVFGADKLTRQRRARAQGHPVVGYEIHHGRVTPGAATTPWLYPDDAHGGAAVGVCSGRIFGTSLHGLFEADDFREAFLVEVGRSRRKRFVPTRVSFAAARERQFDRLADLLETHLDMPALRALINEPLP